MKKIGIIGWKTGENSFGVTTPYLAFISKYGKPEIIMPSKPGYVYENIDLLILPGGMDVNPASYNEVPGFMTGHTDVYKQFFLDNNLNDYIQANIPVFGICLGAQQLNVHFGGSLAQDYPSASSITRSDRLEEVDIDSDFLKKRLNLLTNPKISGYKVNSMHHQAIVSLAPHLEPVAISKAYRNVEAFMHNMLPIAGVQWHPEELNMNEGDSITSMIIKYLLK